MKSTLILLSFALVLSACGEKATTVKTPAVNPRPSGTVDLSLYAEHPADGNYYSRGKVTKINMELGTVEIDHEDLPYLKPPGIREFKVRDKNILNGVAVGETVDFTLEFKQPDETVVAISKAE